MVYFLNNYGFLVIEGKIEMNKSDAWFIFCFIELFFLILVKEFLQAFLIFN